MKSNKPTEKPVPKFYRNDVVFYIYYMLDIDEETYKIKLGKGIVDYSVYIKGSYLYTVTTRNELVQFPQPAGYGRTIFDIPEFLIFDNKEDASIYFAYLSHHIDHIIHQGLGADLSKDELIDRIHSMAGNPNLKLDDVRLWPCKDDFINRDGTNDVDNEPRAKVIKRRK